jgi:hypothetical protein
MFLTDKEDVVPCNIRKLTDISELLTDATITAIIATSQFFSTSHLELKQPLSHV